MFSFNIKKIIMSEYSIHKLTKTDFHKLIPLMKDCFGMDVNIKYFEWKFLNNPSGIVEGYYATDEAGETAAYYGVIPETFKVNGSVKVIYQSCDTMTHSNHRRRGLFQKLAITCYENLRKEDKLFIYGFGGGQSTPGFLKFGWCIVFNMRYYFYPKHFNLFTKLIYKNVFELSNLKELESLALQSNIDSKVASIKNFEILKWRLANPLQSYKIIAYKENDHFSSYLNYYFENDKIIIFDFFVSNLTAGKNLFNYIKILLKNNNKKGIVSFCQEDSYFSATLKKYSFINNSLNFGPLRERTPFILYSTEDEQKYMNNAKFWQINSFEHDAL